MYARRDALRQVPRRRGRGGSATSCTGDARPRQRPARGVCAGCSGLAQVRAVRRAGEEREGDRGEAAPPSRRPSSRRRRSARISEIAKKHENTIRVIQDEASQEGEAVVRHNVRRKQDLTAQCKRYEIGTGDPRRDARPGARAGDGGEVRWTSSSRRARATSRWRGGGREDGGGEITRTMQVQCAERKIKVIEQPPSALESQALLKAAENDSKAPSPPPRPRTTRRRGSSEAPVRARVGAARGDGGLAANGRRRDGEDGLDRAAGDGAELDVVHGVEGQSYF